MVYEKLFWDIITHSGLDSTISINNQEIHSGIPPQASLKKHFSIQASHSDDYIVYQVDHS